MPATTLADAVAPASMAKALVRAGGGHFHAVSRFAAGPHGGDSTAVTTTTDIWLDRTGNYRLSEENDQDGGREVVLFGRELSVALRYGKMIRRAAEEPEPARILEEGLGGLAAAFELVASSARVSRSGGEGSGARTTTLLIGPGDGRGTRAAAEIAGAGLPLTGLRAWRSTTAVSGVSGRVVVDDATGVVLKADVSAVFTAKGEAGPVDGAVEVHALLSDLGTTPAIGRPAEAEDLASRQRIVPEQRELLHGLALARPEALEPPRRGPAKRPHGARP